MLTTNGNYGLSDIFTLYGGIQSMEDDYLAGMLGLAMNTRLGAIAVDVIHSRASLEDIGALQGQSYRVSYSNVLDATQTNFSFSAYRYSTKDYLSLNDVISLQNSIDSYSDDHDTNRNDAYRNSYSHSKNELQANVNQPIVLNGEDYGSFYLSGTGRVIGVAQTKRLSIRWATAILSAPSRGISRCSVVITNGVMKMTACTLG